MLAEADLADQSVLVQPDLAITETFDGLRAGADAVEIAPARGAAPRPGAPNGTVPP